jgi:hypothetical protein
MTSPAPSFALALVLAASCTPSRQATPAPATSQPATQVAPAASAASSTASTPAPEPPKDTPAPEEPRDKRGGCTSDGDCRAFSHYCDGCFCVPLAKGASDLKCKGAHTSCFVDPCRAQRAACRKGACVLVGEAEK